MEKKYDFSKAEQGKLYVPVEDISCLFIWTRTLCNTLMKTRL